MLGEPGSGAAHEPGAGVSQLVAVDLCVGQPGVVVDGAVNVGNRTEEALATGADQIAVACPFCRVMLSDALTSQQAAGSAPESVEVVDVAQMLLAAVRRGTPA
jgi:hypothetical protein